LGALMSQAKLSMLITLSAFGWVWLAGVKSGALMSGEYHSPSVIHDEIQIHF
jgi:hypothetical protein